MGDGFLGGLLDGSPISIPIVVSTIATFRVPNFSSLNFLANSYKTFGIRGRSDLCFYDNF